MLVERCIIAALHHDDGASKCTLHIMCDAILNTVTVWKYCALCHLCRAGDESLCCKLGLKVKMGSEKIANVA